jgi:hypothetical protein
MLDTLRDVFDFGAARVPFRFLNRWFEAERLTKRVWSGLRAAWDRVLEERGDSDGWRLGFIQNGRSDEITLVCLDPDGAATSCLKPIEKFG